jgi:glucose 1-dehydrogenase
MAAERRGVIVNISSVHESIPWSGYAHYGASKGGTLMIDGGMSAYPTFQ